MEAVLRGYVGGRAEAEEGTRLRQHDVGGHEAVRALGVEREVELDALAHGRQLERAWCIGWRGCVHASAAGAWRSDAAGGLLVVGGVPAGGGDAACTLAERC